MHDGDTIAIDVERRRLDVELPEAELRARRATVVAPAREHVGGVLAKYASLVRPASEGAVTRPPGA